MFKNLSSSPNIEVEFEMIPTSLKIDEDKLSDHCGYPLAVTVTTADEKRRNGAPIDVSCILELVDLSFLTFSGLNSTRPG